MKENIILIAIGTLAGAFSGLLGIGWGVIVIPLLILFLGYSQQLAQGTSLALLLPPISIFAVINYYNAGFVDVKATIIMVFAFIFGSYLSSRFIIDINEVYLKKGFAIFLILYAIKILLDK